MSVIVTRPPPGLSLSYDQAMQFWFGRINYEQRSPKPSDLKLDRMRLLLDLLGNPQRRLRIVHVAGSKGKGSTSAMLAAVFRQAGYRTGLFTSPHLERVEERIQVDGEPISPAELARLMAEVQQAEQQLDGATPTAPPCQGGSGGAGVTFFEVATALGFMHFARRRVELAVVEVGLGGRFDSTNVCQPLVSLITSISFDHTQQLGYTLASIAFEKAGIIKPGRPTISGVRVPEARKVIEDMARQRCSPLRQLAANFSFTHEPACIQTGQTRPARVQVTTGRRHWPTMELALVGEHQAANAALVVAAVEDLQQAGLRFADAALAAGLAQVHWPARLEVVGHQPLVILDCAHNLASARALVETLHASFPLTKPGHSRRLLLFAGSRDKDLAGMLHLLAPHFAHVYCTRFASNPRGVTPEHLAQLLPPGTAFTNCPTSIQALRQAQADARPEDQICITGSVFIAGELRPELVGENR